MVIGQLGGSCIGLRVACPLFRWGFWLSENGAGSPNVYFGSTSDVQITRPAYGGDVLSVNQIYQNLMAMVGQGQRMVVWKLTGSIDNQLQMQCLSSLLASANGSASLETVGASIMDSSAPTCVSYKHVETCISGRKMTRTPSWNMILIQMMMNEAL